MRITERKSVKTMIYLFIILFITPVFPQIITTPLNKEVKVDNLEKKIKSIMETHKIPGLSIAILNNNEIVYHNVFGVVNSNTKEPVDKNTIFEAASLSKPLFAFFTLKLWEDGKINIDKPVHEYLEHPGIDNISIDDYKLITPRMILSHSSGFPNFSEGKPVKLPFKPGNGFLYSGEGYQYLAAIIGKLHGFGWKDKLNSLFRNTIAKPIGMKRSTYLWNEEIAKDKAYGHKDGIPTDNNTGGWSGETFNAYSSLHSEAYEYAKFVEVILNKKLLNESTYSEMLKTQNKFDKKNELFLDTGQTGWGLGFAQKKTNFGMMHLHTGNNHDFQSYVMFIPAKKFGIVMFTNCGKMLTFVKELEKTLDKLM